MPTEWPDDSMEPPLDPRLARAVALLREPEPISAEWRAEVLTRARWRHRPARSRALVATLGAAAALCLAVGAGWWWRTSAAADHRAASAVRSAPPVHFAFSAPEARHVALVGDFDGWNPRGLPMRRAPDGRTWYVDVRLAPGRHVFAFSVDGGLRVDPAAPRAMEDDFGTPTSVVVVTSRGVN